MSFALEPNPAQPSNGRCAAAGRETFAFTLVSRRGGKEASSRVEVVQLARTGAEPVAFATNAVKGDYVIASGEKNVALWGDRVRISTVAACERAVSVEHEGRTASLPASGAPSDGLKDTRLSGIWMLRSRMSAQERANPSLRPKALEIIATFHCVKEGE